MNKILKLFKKKDENEEEFKHQQIEENSAKGDMSTQDKDSISNPSPDQAAKDAAREEIKR